MLKLKFAPKAFDRRLVAEMWLYPDNSRILELSTKCAAGGRLPGSGRSPGVPLDRGVDLDGEQATKTRKALEYFSRQLEPTAT